MNSSHLTLFAFLVMISTCSAYISGDSLIQRTEPRYYCGKRLAMTMSLLCEPSEKRSESNEKRMFGSLVANRYRDDDSYPGSWPWMLHHRAMGMNPVKRGIVEECCEKPCTIPILLQYC